MMYPGNGGMICGPFELSKPIVSAALLLRSLRGSDELTIHPAKESPGVQRARGDWDSRSRSSCPWLPWLHAV